MFIELDEVREFALKLAEKLKEERYVAFNQDVHCIQEVILEETLTKIKQDDCLVPDGEAYHVTDYCDNYMVAFISCETCPLGIFTIFTDEIEDAEPRLFVSINHTVVYLDEQIFDIN